MYQQNQTGYPQQGYPQQSYPQQGYQSGYGGGDPGFNIGMPPAGGGFDGGGNGSALFNDKEIRNKFVSKVFTILTAQLTFTVTLIAIFVSNSGIKDTFKPGSPNSLWIFLGFGLFFVSFMVLACVESARRSFPLNFILLSVLTAGYSLVAAITACRYNNSIVLYAAIATAISTLLISLLAKSTKFDMTSCGTTLCLLSLAHLVIGSIMAIILIAMGKPNLAHLLLAISGAFLVSLYLMFDMQLILGGRKAELSPEEYIMGAIMLYTDIIQLFIYLLEIFNQLSKDN